MIIKMQLFLVIITDNYGKDYFEVSVPAIECVMLWLSSPTWIYITVKLVSDTDLWHLGIHWHDCIINFLSLRENIYFLTMRNTVTTGASLVKSIFTNQQFHTYPHPQSTRKLSHYELIVMSLETLKFFPFGIPTQKSKT